MTYAEAIKFRKQAANNHLYCVKPNAKAIAKHDKNKMDEAMKLALITFMNGI